MCVFFVFFEKLWRSHCEGDKSSDINHCIKVKGIQSSAQQEEPLIACLASALLSCVLQIKQQLLRAAARSSLCAFAFARLHLYLCSILLGLKKTKEACVRCKRWLEVKIIIDRRHRSFSDMTSSVRGPTCRALQLRLVALHYYYYFFFLFFFFPTVNHTGERVFEMQGCMVLTLPWVVMHELLATHCCCRCCLLC